MNTKLDLLERYLIVGLLAYGIEMVVLYGLHNLLGWSPLSAVAFSFWAGTISAFLLQKVLAFRNYNKQWNVVMRQVFAYAALVAWNYMFTLLIVRWFEQLVPVYIIRSAAIIIIMSWNFLLYRLIFRQAHE